MNKLTHKELMDSLADTYALNHQYFPESYNHESFLNNYYPGTFLSESVLNRLESLDEPLCYLGDYWPPNRDNP